MRKWIAAFVAVSAMALPATAGADPGNGAEPFSYSDCWTYEFGTSCWDAKGVYNTTENKNSISGFYNERYAYSFTGAGPYAGCNETSEGSYKQHFLFKKDQVEDQVNHYQFKASFVIQCGQFPLNVQCTSEGASHYANGEVRHERHEFVCEPI